MAAPGAAEDEEPAPAAATRDLVERTSEVEEDAESDSEGIRPSPQADDPLFLSSAFLPMRKLQGDYDCISVAAPQSSPPAPLAIPYPVGAIGPSLNEHQDDYISFVFLSDTHGLHSNMRFEDAGGSLHQIQRFDYKGRPLVAANTSEIEKEKPSGATVPVHAPPSPSAVSEGESARPFGGDVVPYGDVLCHCGDWTMLGGEREVEEFVSFLKQLPHPHKIVIAGNHDVVLDEKYLNNNEADAKQHFPKLLKSINKNTLPKRLKKKLKEVCAYLDHEGVEIEVQRRGREQTQSKLVRIFGSPLQPHPRPETPHRWAFGRARGKEIRAEWETMVNEWKCGSGFDVLLTHGPPFGRHDRVVASGSVPRTAGGRNRTKRTAAPSLCDIAEDADTKPADPEVASSTVAPLDAGRAKTPVVYEYVSRVGCADLTAALDGLSAADVAPKVHAFGHVHEDSGMSFDGKVLYVNATTCNRAYALRESVPVPRVYIPVDLFPDALAAGERPLPMRKVLRK